MPFSVRKPYALLTIFLFVTEVLIARYMHDGFVRPYLGDFLVVMLLYCFVRTFLTVTVSAACIGVLLFSYAIEVSQYFHLSSLPLFRGSKIARVVLGNSFEWQDLGLYTAGIIVILFLEYFFKNKQ